MSNSHDKQSRYGLRIFKIILFSEQLLASPDFSAAVAIIGIIGIKFFNNSSLFFCCKFAFLSLSFLLFSNCDNGSEDETINAEEDGEEEEGEREEEEEEVVEEEEEEEDDAVMDDKDGEE